MGSYLPLPDSHFLELRCKAVLSVLEQEFLVIDERPEDVFHNPAPTRARLAKLVEKRPRSSAGRQATETGQKQFLDYFFVRQVRRRSAGGAAGWIA